MLTRKLPLILLLGMLLPSSLRAAGSTVKTLWRSGSLSATPLAHRLISADMDGNGVPDIVGCSAGTPYVLTNRGLDYVLLWYGPPAMGCSAVAVGDVDGDAIPEIFVGADTSQASSAGMLYQFSMNSLEWTRRVTLPVAAQPTGLAFGDVDGDAAAEVVVSTSLATIVFDAATLNTEWVANGRGGRDPRIGNVDGDPQPEIVVNANPAWILNASTKSLEWAYNGGFGSRFDLADVDGDGVCEFIANTGVSIWVIDSQTLTERWRKMIDGADSMAALDLDGNGESDVLAYPSYSGQHTALRGRDGTTLWTAANPPGRPVAGAAYADVDADGIKEIVAATSEAFYVRGISGWTPEWQETFYSRAAAFRADVDRDGDVETIASISGGVGAYSEGQSTLGVPEWKLTISSYYGGELAGLAQLDDDASLEILYRETSGSPQFKTYDGTTRAQEGSTGPLGAVSAFAVENVDNDARQEIVVAQDNGSIYVFNGATPLIQASTSVNTYVSGLDIGDVDGDGAQEVAVAAGASVVLLDAATLQTRATAPISGTASRVAIAPRRGSLPGEIVVALTTNTYPNPPWIVGYRFTGSALEKTWECSGSSSFLKVAQWGSRATLVSYVDRVLDTYTLTGTKPCASRLRRDTWFATPVSAKATGPRAVEVVSTTWGSTGILQLSFGADADDLDGSGTADLLVQNGTTGEVSAYLLNGSAVTTSGGVAAGGEFQVKGSGDLDGNGTADLVLRNAATGEIRAWLMNGKTRVSDAMVGNPGGSYDVAGMADFNGDAMADILLRDGSGNIGLWMMSGTAIASGGFVGSPGDYQVAGAGDFTGDGKADILLRDSLGNLGLWIMDGAAIVSGAFVGSPAGYSVAGVNDFNADARTDILLQDSLGNIGLWMMNGAEITSGAFVGSPSGYAVVATGDYNADLKADIVLHHAATGNVGMWLMDGATVVSGSFVTTLPSGDAVR